MSLHIKANWFCLKNNKKNQLQLILFPSDSDYEVPEKDSLTINHACSGCQEDKFLHSDELGWRAVKAVMQRWWLPTPCWQPSMGREGAVERLSSSLDGLGTGPAAEEEWPMHTRHYIISRLHSRWVLRKWRWDRDKGRCVFDTPLQRSENAAWGHVWPCLVFWRF